MKLRDKFLTYLVSFAFLSFLVIAIDSFYNIDTNIISNIESKMQAIASIQQNRIISVTSNYITLISQVAARTGLIKNLALL